MKPYLVALNLNGMDRGRRQGRAEDPAAGPGRARPDLLRIDPRQRLPRPDRHPRPHPGRRRGAAARQPRRPRLAACPSSTASRPARVRSRARPCRRRPAKTGRAPAESRRRSPRSIAEARTERRSAARGRGLRDRRGSPASRATRSATRGASVGPDLTTAGACLSARGDRRVGPLAETQGQGGLRGDRRGDRRRQGRPGLQAGGDRRRSWSSATPTTGERVRIAKADDRGRPRGRHADARGPGRRDDAPSSAATWSGS